MRVSRGESAIAQAMMNTLSDRLQQVIKDYATKHGISYYEAIVVAILLMEQLQETLERRKK
jgi:hypothetical protein